jgi:serine/threonine protein kinase
VIAARPHGIDAADMAWIFNRLLAALAVAHAQGIVHGAVTPDHLLLRLSDHNGILIDWCYSVEIGSTIAAISPPYRAFYPPEVLAKQPATPATDLYMAAQCMVALLGGDVAAGQIPPATPRPIAALLRGCLIPSPHRRAQGAWEIFGEFRDILARIYGPPHFRPFTL